MYAPAGRPREFTYHKRRELLQHIQQGSTTAEAAQIVGVTLRTVQRAARFDEFFHHDLELARHAAPVDPYKLVSHAARTHWRAAAWLLERKDPDRFGRRKPNACRPEMLQEVSDWLIETALETVTPDQREAVYKRMRGVADKACATLMPAQHEARRALEQQLPNRPLPLSEHEWQKTWGVVPDKPEGVTHDVGGISDADSALPFDDALLPQNPPAPSPRWEQRAQATQRRLSAGGSQVRSTERGEGGCATLDLSLDIACTRLSTPPYPSPSRGGDRKVINAEHAVLGKGAAAESLGSLDATPPTPAVADPIAYYRENPPEPPPAERPSNYVGGFRLLDSERVDQEWREHLAEQDDVIDFGERSDEPADFTHAAYEDGIASAPGGFPSHVEGISPSHVGGVSDGDSWVARPRSSVGRGALEEVDATSTTPTEDLGVPPGLSHPPTEGNMSPKIDSATSPDVAANDAAISSAAERLRDLWEWRFRGSTASQPAEQPESIVKGPT